MTTLDPPDRAMRRVLLALAVFFVIIALILLRAAMNPAPAGAESACFRWESTEVAEYQRTITTPAVTEIRHQVAKHTRERTQESIAGWQRYSFVKPGGWEHDTPPPGPSEKPEWWQANVAGDPHGRGEAGPYFVSRGNSGKGDWFYLESTQTPGPWLEWSEPVLWEPLSHEGWVLEPDLPAPVWQPHHREAKYQRDWAVLPTGQTRVEVIQPEVVSREVDWFADPPGDGWEPTGATDVEIVHVEVPCPDEPPVVDEPEQPAPPVEEPIECPTGDGHTVGVDPGSYDDCPPLHEEPVEPTSEPPSEVEVEVVPAAAVEQPRTLPRTGIETWQLLTVAAVLAWLGGSLLGLEAYDRHKRARS